MKKFILITVFFLATISAIAQYYIGGSIGLNGNSSKNSDGNKVGFSNLNFSIAPEIGKNISEKVDIGISIGIILNNRNSYQLTPGEVNSKQKFTALIASPYLRYSFIKFGDFDILGKVALNFSENTNKFYNREGVQTDKNISTTIGINLAPLLFYNLSEKISLYTQLNFLSLDCSSTFGKAGSLSTGSSTYFTFGANSDNIVSVDQIKIGAVYKF